MKQSSQRRTRRNSETIFLERLSKEANGESVLVPNSQLRNSLGWDDAKYTDVKRRLRNARKIVVGQGQGGKVGLATEPTGKPLSLFISYCHIDEEYKNEFIKHSKPLERLNLIKNWHDEDITAGKNLNSEILFNLRNADIVILLISADYLNSYYCIEKELKIAMEAHERGEKKVIPVIIRNCVWQFSPFAGLKALPADAIAVSSWPNRDEAMASVVVSLKSVADELKKIANQ